MSGVDSLAVDDVVGALHILEGSPIARLEARLLLSACFKAFLGKWSYR